MDVKKNNFYLITTSGVTSSEKSYFKKGLQRLIDETGFSCEIVSPETNYFDLFTLEKNKEAAKGEPGFVYNFVKKVTADEIVSNSMIGRKKGYGEQANSANICFALDGLVNLKGNKMMLVDNDLTMYPRDRDNNFVFGSAMGIIGVVSVARYRGMNSEDYSNSLQFIAAHEFGHQLGLVTRKNNHIDILGDHCARKKGHCVMEQVNCGNQDGFQTLEIEDLAKILFNRQRLLCSDCVEEVKGHINESFKKI